MRPSAVRPSVMGDVARLAGVTHQTVSRVMNDHLHIRPTTRAKVEKAARSRPGELPFVVEGDLSRA